MFKRFGKGASKIKQMKISIFNINMWLLPFYYSKHNKDRLKKLVDFIKIRKPDVVTLQEIPLKRHVKYIQKNLPEYFVSHHSGRVLNKSALVILSKDKPVKTEFFPFPKEKIFTKSERIITKGVFVTHFKNKVSVYNTHFYLVKEDNYNSLLEKQFDFTKSIMEKKNICFLCGDLNMDKQHFDRVNNGFYSYAENSKITFAQDNRYHKKWWDNKVQGNKKIDYILVKISKTKKISYKSETIKQGLSDHYGIYSQIKVD